MATTRLPQQSGTTFDPTGITSNSPFTSGTVLSPVNQAGLAKVLRRFSELLLDAQKHKGDGRICIDAHIDNGQLDNRVSVHPKWDEVL
jgi:hypothetical protein